MHRKVLRLGTRRSLLAMAQSRQVAQAIEAVNPDLKVELVGIETKGDMLLDVSLQKTEGKDFFVAEIDKELLEGGVDLAVHSFKDLSLERPPSLVLAAVPERQYAHDIVLFHPRVKQYLLEGKPIKIGTSAPRRLENLAGFLHRSLPKLASQKPNLKFIEIRGNVNTRLSRLREPEGSSRQLEGVVLALAGLNRLYADSQGKAELERLIAQPERLLFQIIPLSQNPTAPAQGALAVECRNSDIFLKECLQKIHHEPTAKAVRREREVLRAFGGGCHQRFGASVVLHPEIGEILFVKGKKSDGSELFIEEQNFKEATLSNVGAIFNGMSAARGNPSAEPLYLTAQECTQIAHAKALFISHQRALTQQVRDLIDSQILLVAGNKTWFSLAEQGLWISGSADSFGSQALFELLANSPVLQVEQPLILTHRAARLRRQDKSIATYVSHPTLFAEEVSKADLIFWSSGSQFLAHLDFVKPQAVHACGCGETVAVLRQHGIEPKVFYNEQQFKKWSGLSS